MPLPAFAAQADVETRLGRALDADEVARVAAWLDDASSLVRDAIGRDYVEDGVLVADVPHALLRVTAQAVVRAVRNPEGKSEESAGSYSYRLGGEVRDGVYLTDDERREVRRAASRTGIGSLGMTRGTGGVTRYVGDGATGSDPVPFESSDDPPYWLPQT